jgi:ketosteroid isomerase-like protein
VRAVVGKLQDDWNRGDMEAYLAAYANTAATALLSGNTPLRSWQKIAEVYRHSYPDPRAMGRFEVRTLEVRPGEGGYAIASGTFQHTFPTLLVDGAFTLVLERDTSGRWLIVHEHTSRGGATTHN